MPNTPLNKEELRNIELRNIIEKHRRDYEHINRLLENGNIRAGGARRLQLITNDDAVNRVTEIFFADRNAAIREARIDTVIDEEYLLECFNAVARYAQNPEELAGMKPETAVINYRNHMNHALALQSQPNAKEEE